MRRLAAAAVTLLLVLSGPEITGAHATPRETSDTVSPAVLASPPNAYTANICGALGCAGTRGSYNQTFGLKIRLLQAGGIPAYIGIQEACWGQVLDLAGWLRANVHPSYQVAMHAQRTFDAATICANSGGVAYGVAAIVLATSGTPQDTGAFPGSVQDPNDIEMRGFACILGSAFGFYTGCSAHMKSGTGYADDQFRSYVTQEINPRAYGSNPHPVWWGGDLYVVPTDLADHVPGWSYSQHYEADRCGGSVNRWTYYNVFENTTNKWDYLFRSGPGRSCAADAVLWPATTSEMYPWSYTSDHRIEAGTWG